MYQSVNYVNWQRQQMAHRVSKVKPDNTTRTEVGQFGNYQKMRQSVALVQGSHFNTS